jgi:hypothetical protein
MTLLCAVVGAAGAQDTRPAEHAGDVTMVALECTPVAAYWDGPPRSGGMPPGPDLAVVSIDVRPKNARVHLDGRFVGRARYLDGKPGYLYLEPGKYQLELRLEGHRTVLVELDATSACRFDLKHRLGKGQSTAPQDSDAAYGKGEPFNRVYAPMDKPRAALPSPPTTGGPDPDLRKDLDLRPVRAVEPAKSPGASIRLRVRPDSASISIDGVFVATARELKLMENPLATTAGKHELLVSAPGYEDVSKSIEIGAGDVVELDIILSAYQTN